MNRSILGGALWLLWLISPVWGDPLVSVESQYMLNTNVERRFPILVSSTALERVEGVNLAVQIGDGGTVNTGSNTTPRITNLDIIGSGTIFNASNTGCTPLYVSLNGLPPYLIATADTTTASGDLEANGVLGWLTVNPYNATVGLSYKIDLENVGLTADDGPWTTDFTTLPASFPATSSYIYIVSLHDMIWNGGVSGLWTDPTWSDSQPPYPNYTANAIVNAAKTVNVTSAQEANSLTLSGNGNVTVTSSGSLVLTTTGSVAVGSTLQIAGSLNAQDITLNGFLKVTAGGTADVSHVSGNGGIRIGDGGASSYMTVSSIYASSLSIGSGCKLTIRGLTAELLSGDEMTPVPEPATITLLIIAGLGLCLGLRRKFQMFFGGKVKSGR